MKSLSWRHQASAFSFSQGETPGKTSNSLGAIESVVSVSARMVTGQCRTLQQFGVACGVREPNRLGSHTLMQPKFQAPQVRYSPYTDPT